LLTPVKQNWPQNKAVRKTAKSNRKRARLWKKKKKDEQQGQSIYDEADY
jgi:hypothetical protein